EPVAETAVPGARALEAPVVEKPALAEASIADDAAIGEPAAVEEAAPLDEPIGVAEIIEPVSEPRVEDAANVPVEEVRDEAAAEPKMLAEAEASALGAIEGLLHDEPVIAEAQAVTPAPLPEAAVA